MMMMMTYIFVAVSSLYGRMPKQSRKVVDHFIHEIHNQALGFNDIKKKQ